MSIAQAIIRARSKIKDCYDALADYRATIPETKDLAHMPASIESIQAVVDPTIYGADAKDNFYNITSSGPNYWSTGTGHDIDITYTPTSLTQWTTPLSYRWFWCNGMHSFTLRSFTNTGQYGCYYMCARSTNMVTASIPDLTTVGNYGLNYAFDQCTSLTTLSLPNVQTISTGNHAFGYMCRQCTALTSIDLHKIVTATGTNMFQYICYGCTALTSANFSGLTTCGASSAFSNAFYGCTNLESIDLSNFTSFPTSTTAYNSQFYRAFYNCKKLTTFTFPKLTNIGGATTHYGEFRECFAGNQTYTVEVYFPEVTTIYQANATAANATFYNCNKMTKIYLPKLTSIQGAAPNVIFNSCSALTEIHFGAANQATIEAMSGYATLWGRGAGAATVYFDL